MRRAPTPFTASAFSFQGGINVPGQAAAKSGVSGLIRALSNEWAGRGVTVNGIAPGCIATGDTRALPRNHTSMPPN
ncbi:SDR family NAD(P)-dependent oxidoreductase [Streptomyces sp. NPDC047990]|uniref:SDR family NAD(P)-dependent oxidoreductase n=1 Tax=Streptomyces sp. NPDC047990 TaxID=3365496 RepID=UPI00371A7486